MPYALKSKRYEYLKAWREQQRDQLGEEGLRIYRRDAHLRSRFGISLQEWEQRFKEQGEVCAICGKIEKGNWHTDHDHETGQFRGILCSPCNRALGYFGDNIEGLMKALDYLLENTPDSDWPLLAAQRGKLYLG